MYYVSAIVGEVKLFSYEVFAFLDTTNQQAQWHCAACGGGVIVEFSASEFTKIQYRL